ncbi:MAG: competence/damage-inducible protein A [Acidaminococcales bacterium]|jgi:nicotinamide-nucleotide amidase|nr:competence/damage-inducible protein A [Acidaminococcales bacterium]
MRVEIVSTGTELLLGEIVNANFRYLAERLNALGFDVLYETTVGDNWERMKEVISRAAERADIVVTTGGLGPTPGDITKEVTAEVLQKKLVLNKGVEDKIRGIFAARQMEMTANNIKQAMVPEGCEVIDNERGTAPGIFAADGARVIINLPGPPGELAYMFENKAAPLLLEKYGAQGVNYSRVLRLAGMGESMAAEKLHDLITGQSNPTIALYARQGELIVRLTAKAADTAKADLLLDGMEREVRKRVDAVYGVNDESLPAVLGKWLSERRLTIALAESCTGGLASSMLTDIPGSSGYFLGSVVSYSNQAKTGVIDVDGGAIAAEGAVSEIVAKQMAEGAARLFAADVGVGITGIAGPGGASAEKPVGTVYVSVFFQGTAAAKKFLFGGGRLEIKLRTAKSAIFYVLAELKKYNFERK